MRRLTAATLLATILAIPVVLLGQTHQFKQCVQVSASTIGTSGGRICSGTGSPETALTGWVGDIYLRRDGGAGTTIYVKESGAGTNTGWIAYPKTLTGGATISGGAFTVDAGTSGARLTGGDSTTRFFPGFMGHRSISGMTELGGLNFGHSSTNSGLMTFEWHTDSANSALANTKFVLQVRKAGNGKALTADGSAATPLLNWDGDISADNAFYERGRSVAMGEWSTVAYNSGNFTCTGGGSWTVDSGDVGGFSYTVIGKTMMVSLSLTSTSVTGTCNLLQVTIPGSFVAATQSYGAIPYLLDGGATPTTGQSLVNDAGTVIQLQKLDATAWSVSTNATRVRTFITFPIQ